MDYYYNPVVNFLLINQSDLKITVTYDSDREFQLPMIDSRPPYYTNPKYEPYFPKF